MNLIDLIRSKVKDDSGKLSDPDDLTNSCTEALNRYSKVRPLEVVVDIPGGGTHDVDLPIDWIEGFSSVIQVEYPVDRVPAEIIPQRFCQIYASPTGKKLRVWTINPTADEMVRQTYTILHSEDSVPVVDLEAVANLAASICCRILANALGNTSDPTIQADVVNYRSKSGEFTRLADKLEGLYKAHLGIKDDDTVAASMVTATPPDTRRTRGRLYR